MVLLLSECMISYTFSLLIFNISFIFQLWILLRKFSLLYWIKNALYKYWKETEVCIQLSGIFRFWMIHKSQQNLISFIFFLCSSLKLRLDKSIFWVHFMFSHTKKRCILIMEKQNQPGLHHEVGRGLTGPLYFVNSSFSINHTSVNYFLFVFFSLYFLIVGKWRI